MAIVGLPVLIGPILGPVLGGVIINYLNWRWIFYVNLPVCFIALILAVWGLPKDDAPNQPQKLDILGLSLLSPSIVLIIYGLTKVNQIMAFCIVQSSSLLSLEFYFCWYSAFMF